MIVFSSMSTEQPVQLLSPTAPQRRIERVGASFRRIILPGILGLVIVIPAVFFFLAVQHSAILFPFWDHCEFINEFASIQAGTFHLRDLWAPHNHSRLFASRAVTLANGLLTGWDIGSEYVYLEWSIILSFILQLLCFRKLFGTWSSRCLVLGSIASIFTFSPAGHNNHWWSFMLQLDLTHLLIIVAFLCLCLGVRTWKNNVLAALACWVAAYTLGNGLVAFVAAAITVHLSQKPILRFDRFSAFWLLNIVSVLVCDLPGLSETPSSQQSVAKLLVFCLAYLGSPVATLFHFPYRNMFDVPPVTVFNALFGGFALAFAAALVLLLRKKFASPSPAILLFVAFSTFALGSALLTALGRAEFDAVGVDNANASRYTIFASYFVYAMLYLTVEIRKTDLPESFRRWNAARAAKMGACTFVLVFFSLSANSYAKSWSIYHEAHNYNQQLGAAFWGDYQSNQKYVYPNAERLTAMVSQLKRMRIGPYRFVHPDGNDAIDILANQKTIDQFGVNGLREIPGVGKILFSNPASRFQMQVPPSVKAIHFSFGILDNAVSATPAMAGVEFRVLLKQGSGEEKLLWQQKLDPVSMPKNRGTQTADVPIAFPETSEIIFETRAVNSPQGCWAYWQNVSVQN